MDAVITFPIKEEDSIFKNVDVMLNHPLIDFNLDTAAERSLAIVHVDIWLLGLPSLLFI